MEALIPITLFVMIGLVSIFRGPFGKALGERIAGGSSGAPSRELEELRHEVRSVLDDVQFRLTEMEERLDFAERLLAQARQRESLPGDK